MNVQFWLEYAGPIMKISATFRNVTVPTGDQVLVNGDMTHDLIPGHIQVWKRHFEWLCTPMV